LRPIWIVYSLLHPSHLAVFPSRFFCKIFRKLIQSPIRCKWPLYLITIVVIILVFDEDYRLKRLVVFDELRK
jgi:hypothetical protein